MQKYVKKGDSSKFSDGKKSRHESSSRSEDCPFQPLQDVIGEIKTIVGGALHRRVIQVP